MAKPASALASVGSSPRGEKTGNDGDKPDSGRRRKMRGGGGVLPTNESKDVRHAAATERGNGSGGGGLDAIDALFATKKENKKREKEEDRALEEEERRRRKARRTSDEQGSAANKGAHVPSQYRQSAKSVPLSHDRTDAERLASSNDWVSDGLGGIFNGDGFTGRRDESGHKIFKAHLFNRKGFGQSKDCPFDCDCCYI